MEEDEAGVVDASDSEEARGVALEAATDDDDADGLSGESDERSMAADATVLILVERECVCEWFTN